jgi:hypothetical protein
MRTGSRRVRLHRPEDAAWPTGQADDGTDLCGADQAVLRPGMEVSS